jgi:hypothetical protein
MGGQLIYTMPVYTMACFKLPRWVIKRLEKIMRDFLWEGTTHLHRREHT